MIAPQAGELEYMQDQARGVTVGDHGLWRAVEPFVVAERREAPAAVVPLLGEDLADEPIAFGGREHALDRCRGPEGPDAVVEVLAVESGPEVTTEQVQPRPGHRVVLGARIDGGGPHGDGGQGR